MPFKYLKCCGTKTLEELGLSSMSLLDLFGVVEKSVVAAILLQSERSFISEISRAYRWLGVLIKEGKSARINPDIITVNSNSF